jgi:hypothetical protein
MKFGEARNDEGGEGDNIESDTARIMPSVQMNIRRRPSTTFNDKTSSSGRITDEEATGLLKDEENDSLHYQDIRNGKRYDARHSDCSRWLRPVSLVLSILVLAVIVFASSDTLLRSSHLSLNIFNFFHLGGDGAGSSHKIGIELNPTNHVFRTSKKISHDWTITKGFLSPDGVRKEVYLVNGEFPGPTIQCRSGDKLIIHVTNLLTDEGVSIHWHGLQMRNENSMDGAVGFTQCPIPPGKKFTYEFDVDADQSGTFWWHAHSQTQRGDGMYGGLIVHKPNEAQSDMEIYGYKKEMLFLIGDWYHRNGTEVLDWYTSVRGFGNEVCSIN